MPNLTQNVKDVHTEHCCIVHGCKYGNDSECTVTSVGVRQSYPCEMCGPEYDHILWTAKGVDKLPSGAVVVTTVGLAAQRGPSGDWLVVGDVHTKSAADLVGDAYVRVVFLPDVNEHAAVAMTTITITADHVTDAFRAGATGVIVYQTERTDDWADGESRFHHQEQIDKGWLTVAADVTALEAIAARVAPNVDTLHPEWSTAAQAIANEVTATINIRPSE